MRPATDHFRRRGRIHGQSPTDDDCVDGKAMQKRQLATPCRRRRRQFCCNNENADDDEQDKMMAMMN
jgi:hypothetical protein